MLGISGLALTIKQARAMRHAKQLREGKASRLPDATYPIGARRTALAVGKHRA
jgi:hypothetical protein